MNLHSLAHGVLAAAWLAGLWAAVLPARRNDATAADALRNMMILGTAIPFVLALCGIFSAWTAWIALALVGAALWRLAARATGIAASLPLASWSERLREGLPMVFAVGIIWPPLSRISDNGDTIWYHLPNAAAWAHDGTIWLTTTHYWWYPGGSELFAAGLIAVAGPSAAALSGAVPLLLLGARIATWLGADGVTAWVAGALGAAYVTAFPLADQAVGLQNDVWLAAIFVEILWLGRPQSAEETPADRQRRLIALAGAVAVCGIIKPYGIVFAIAGIIITQAGWRIWIAALAPFAVWVVRDAVLWRDALISESETAVSDLFGTTIVGNALAAPAAALSGITHDGAGTAFLVLTGFAGLIVGAWRIRLAAAFALIVVLCEPFGFRNAIPQLATGSSLRFADPFFALGLIGIAPIARRFPWPCGIVALLIACIGLGHWIAQFWFGEPQKLVLAALAVAIVAQLGLPERWRPRAVVAAGLLFVTLTIGYAAFLPARWYDGELSPSSHVFTWLAANAPATIVVDGGHPGEAIMVSPHTREVDAHMLGAAPSERDSPCNEARRLHALLFVELSQPGAAAIRSTCGTTLYADDAAAIIRPAPG